jgi:hypothetical protein
VRQNPFKAIEAVLFRQVRSLASFIEAMDNRLVADPTNSPRNHDGLAVIPSKM